MSDVDDSSDEDNEFDISDPSQVLKLNKMTTEPTKPQNVLQAELDEMNDLDLESLDSDCQGTNNLYTQLTTKNIADSEAEQSKQNPEDDLDGLDLDSDNDPRDNVFFDKIKSMSSKKDESIHNMPTCDFL